MSPAEERAKRFQVSKLQEQAKKDALNGYAPVYPGNESYMLAYNWALKSTQVQGVK